MRRTAILSLLLCAILSAPLSACKPAHSALEQISSHPHASVSITPAHANVAYAGTRNPAQMLDIYLPPTKARHAPLVLFIHGGAWMIGDKSWIRSGTHMQLEQFLQLLLNNGYAVASVNYRLTPEARFPAQIHDVKAAVRYLRAHAAEFGIDPMRIAVAGESAGGHLAQLLATTDKQAELEGGLGNVGVSSRVKAAVSYYGIADLRRLAAERVEQGCQHPWLYNPNKPNESEYGLFGGGPLDTPQRQQQALRASPIHYVSADTAPMLLLHGRQDCIVAVVQSQTMYNTLQKFGVPSQLYVLDADHAEAKFYTDPQLQQRLLDFLRQYL